MYFEVKCSCLDVPGNIYSEKTWLLGIFTNILVILFSDRYSLFRSRLFRKISGNHSQQSCSRQPEHDILSVTGLITHNYRDSSYCKLLSTSSTRENRRSKMSGNAINPLKFCEMFRLLYLTAFKGNIHI